MPTLVLAGAEDIATPPSLGRLVAERVPGALFEVMEGEAHQPFQEVPDAFNDRVARFWHEADDRGDGFGSPGRGNRANCPLGRRQIGTPLVTPRGSPGTPTPRRAPPPWVASRAPAGG